MLDEAFEKLCEWKQAIAELPLEKWKEKLQKNLTVIQNMLIANRQNPEELTQQIKALIDQIKTTLFYLNFRLETLSHRSSSDFDL
jgi:hypothetical protein